MQRSRIDWTRDMDEYLLSHYEVMSLCDIALRLGISQPSVSQRLHVFGIEKVRGARKRVWSDVELEYLRVHYPSESLGDIADVLHLSTVMIRNKALELGLKKSADYDPSKYYSRYVKDYKNRGNKVVA